MTENRSLISPKSERNGLFVKGMLLAILAVGAHGAMSAWSRRHDWRETIPPPHASHHRTGRRMPKQTQHLPNIYRNLNALTFVVRTAHRDSSRVVGNNV